MENHLSFLLHRNRHEPLRQRPFRHLLRNQRRLASLNPDQALCVPNQALYLPGRPSAVLRSEHPPPLDLALLPPPRLQPPQPVRDPPLLPEAPRDLEPALSRFDRVPVLRGRRLPAYPPA